MTVDGFIADPAGGYDWIVMDPAIDFEALFAQFDTFVMGRKTFEVTARTEFMKMIAGKEVVVVSRTLAHGDHPGITVAADPQRTVRALKAGPGRDIWLFGGGVLFRQLVDAGLVDTIEVAVMPVLLARGVPVLPPGLQVRGLRLASHTIFPSGIVMLVYTLGDAVLL